ncbi:uncharacterized protein LOC111591960 isoform X2 [Drosophila hydei]|uniref:Uncharacterized protein LOC111591960 isoform X2 n=1 Tax=Drosophila hydei TaxID=7224 RepID=A0A6J1L929_DROHY|nr:uncharacterized protein LOC111591960 isoform X2 [Drosophila hydei]
MSMPQVRGCSKGCYPLMLLLLLLLADLGYAEEHPHRHAHNGTTSAPNGVHARRNHQQSQRLQQLQWAQDGNGLDGLQLGNGYHHLRHEQHLRAELAGNDQNRQPPLSDKLMLGGPGEQHHLRHHNRHHAAWQQRVFPELRRQSLMTTPATATAAATSTTIAPATHLVTDAPLQHVAVNDSNIYSSKRYFDRDGIYPAWMQPRSTRAPNWRQQLVDSDEDDSADEDDDEDDDEDYEDDEMDDQTDQAVNVAAELAKQMPRYSFFSQQLPDLSASDQDYDYDQAEPNVPNNNKHPNVAANHPKAAAKRNIFNWLFKPSKEKVQLQLRTTTTKPNAESLSQEQLFSNEQWNKIEHEHHLKQQQHQKELQALRDSNRNRNAPLIRSRAVGIDNENADNNNNYARNRIGSQTAHKEKLLGTPEAVLNARREREEAKAKANAHIEEVLKENSCHLPQKRCMSAGRDPSKIYMPHCTFVHRCSEDSGCCHSRTEICAPKRTHKVEKYFFVKALKDKRSKPEMLTFVNHTECHCIDRSNYYAEGIISSSGAVVQRATMLNCNCPGHFERILQNDGQCRCDCSSSNYDCDYRKRGSEHFSLEDRKCIKEGRCKPPTCQYGPYMEKIGRCPNYHEQTSHPMNNYNAVDMS